MLMKLIKHEFLAIGRVFLAIFAFMVILTPLFSLMMRFGIQIKSEINAFTFVLPISIAGYVLLMIAAYIASYVLIVLRFYRTISTSEAYLTFTLPVPAWQIVFSKWLAALILEILTGILSLTSIITTLVLSGAMTLQDMVRMIREIVSLPLNDQQITGVLIFVLLSALAGTAAGIAQFHCSISLGQLMNDHRVLFSIAFYMAIYIVQQIISMFATLPLHFLSNTADGSRVVDSVLIFGIVQNLLFAAGFFIVSCLVLKKKLNVH